MTAEFDEFLSLKLNYFPDGFLCVFARLVVQLTTSIVPGGTGTVTASSTVDLSFGGTACIVGGHSFLGLTLLSNHGRATGHPFGSGMRPVIGSPSSLADARAFGARLGSAWAASR